METVNQSSEFTKSRRPWLRWLKYLAIVLLPGLIVFVAQQGWRHSEASKKLQETLVVMDRADSGWQLADIEAAREKIPEDENSAHVIVAASNLLPKNWPAWEFSDLFEQLPPEELLPPGDFARLKQELDKLLPALQEARKLSALPRGRHHLEYQSFFPSMLLPGGQQETRRIVRLLCYDALRHDRERDLISALNSCQAAFHAARSLGDEPFAISQLIRMANVIQSCQSIERVLAQGEPPPDRLADFQDLIRREDDFPNLLVLARGERALLHTRLDALESGVEPLQRLYNMLPAMADPIFAWSTREELRQSHPAVLAAMSRYVAIARLPMHEQAAALRQLDLELRSLKQSAPLAFHLILALGNTFDYSQRKHAYLRCLSTALAAERYRREHKQWPAALDKLCPQFLASVLLDPFDGKALRCRRVEDGMIVYSVGSDKTDNNGKLDIDRENPNQPGVDIGVRLWDVSKRRQPPRPKTHKKEQPR